MAESGRNLIVYISDQGDPETWMRLAGVREKSKSLSQDTVDNSGSEKDGYTHLLRGGRKSLSVSVSGVMEPGDARDQLQSHYDNDTFAKLRIDSVTERTEGEFHIGSLEETGSYQDAITFSASFSGHGQWTTTGQVVSVADTSASESADSIDFTLTRDPVFGDCEVDYATSDGTAEAGEDYEATSGTAKFENGASQVVVSVPLLDDATFEGDETLTLTIDNPVNCEIGDATATGTITEDESAPVVSVDQSSYTVDEDTGNMSVQVNIVGAHDVEVTVDYATANGTASAGTDYTADSGTLTWTAGDTTPKTVDITIADRTGGQGQRDFTLTLSNPTNCTLGDDTATITIDDVFHLSDAVAAYDLQDGSSLWQDTAGTTQADTANDPIGRIDDQSGNGNHLLQGTGTAKPTFQNDGTNNYALTDGVDDDLSAQLGSSIGWPLVVACAIRPISGSYGFGLNDTNNLDAVAGNNFRVRDTASESTFFNLSPSTSQTGVTGVWRAALADGDQKLYINGVENDTNTEPLTASFSTSGGIVVGDRVFGTENQATEVRLYRGVIMDRALTSGEAASLDQWLADGSGVTL